MKRFFLVCSFFCTQVVFASGDLPSWQDTKTKAALITFVEKTTKQGSADYIPPEERIAVFDNDGTLWSEQPSYVQLTFAIDRVKVLAPQHPDWLNKQPFKAVLEGDRKALSEAGDKGLIEIIAATHAGMSPEEFHQIVLDWMKTARHPKTGRPYPEMVYQPMLEVLSYLRKHGYKTFIVSGGGVEFMRPWTEAVYGIPPEQVIGSSVKTQLIVKDDKVNLQRLAEVNFINDKEGKPLAINQHIGRRPVIAFGNSDGDLQMLQWTSASRKPSLGVIIHHTDAEREVAYDRQSHIGKLDQALNLSKKQGWLVVDMKTDWKTVFPK
ncbi:haloacid dehalogenase-like hydrolase [Alcaligenaceae bacterium LF4-65]|uniref:Haloacid dehalogenase-like hydrolase n=1 Tax=Zwartia hollandica TaxID=324606 RepID=A0A953NBL4_9BURK|nr:HAD family hydrolase [Zwartia hollandica]MBZ1350295.1 haloacid dehalogenase-like hydrolase [Zwartia hollandica]